MDVTTYSQESWGETPSPNNASQLLLDHFMAFYGGGVLIGVNADPGYSLIYTSVGAVVNSLPACCSPSALTKDEIDPSSTTSGLFGGSVLALQLNVDFADAGFLAGTAPSFRRPRPR